MIWHRTRDLLLADPEAVTYPSPEAKRIVTAFLVVTGGEIRCDQITGRRFPRAADHTTFLREGGCADLLAALTLDH